MFTRFKILPIVILTAVVGLFFKVESVSNGFIAMTQQAQAQAVPATQPNAQAAQQSQGAQAGVDAIDPLMMSRSELDLLQDLSARREALDARAAELSMRERLLEATENQLDDKIAQLQSLEARMQALVNSYEEQESAEMDSLVKIYETMKPKDAAAIFVLLDMSVQLEVAQRMREAKMAPILSNMPPEAARELTTQLATRANLPQIDG